MLVLTVAKVHHIGNPDNRTELFGLRLNQLWLPLGHAWNVEKEFSHGRDGMFEVFWLAEWLNQHSSGWFDRTAKNFPYFRPSGPSPQVLSNLSELILGREVAIYLV